MENLEELVDNIFIQDRIDHPQLKDLLKLISNRLDSKVNDAYSAGAEEEYGDIQVFTQARYLDELITKCEERLNKLEQTPKTRIVIRNEGQKLQSIVESLDCVKSQTSNLQTQIDNLTTAHEKLRKIECERKQNYQDMIDRLYRESMKSDVCNLRTMFYGVQNQVDELIVKCAEMKKDIKEIQTRITIIDVIPELEKKINVLMDWRASLREELELFVERYEHVKTVKAGKCEVQDLLEKKVNFCHLTNYVQNTAFNEAKEKFIDEFKEIKEHFCELQLFLSCKLVALHKDVQMVRAKLDSKRRVEKRSTK